MLYHHHRIGAARERSPGHDFQRFAGLNFSREQFTGANFADYEQLAWQVRGPHGKSIAYRTRERRIITVRGDRFGEHTARSFGQTYWLDVRFRLRLAQLVLVLAQLAQDALAGLLEGERGHNRIVPLDECDAPSGLS